MRAAQGWFGLASPHLTQPLVWLRPSHCVRLKGFGLLSSLLVPLTGGYISSCLRRQASTGNFPLAPLGLLASFRVGAKAPLTAFAKGFGLLSSLLVPLTGGYISSCLRRQASTGNLSLGFARPACRCYTTPAPALPCRHFLIHNQLMILMATDGIKIIPHHPKTMTRIKPLCPVIMLPHP